MKENKKIKITKRIQKRKTIKIDKEKFEKIVADQKDFENIVKKSASLKKKLVLLLMCWFGV